MLISGKGKCFHGVWLHFKKFSGNIFWCLEKKKENTNQKNISHKSRKTQIQNNTSKLRLVHSNIFTENASNQAKETKTQQKKMNQRRATTGATSDDRCHRRSTSVLVERAPLIDRAARRLTSNAIIRTIELVDRAARRRGAIVRRAARLTIATALLVNRRAVRVRRARSSIAPLDRRSCRAISSIAPLVGVVRSSDERRD